MEYSKQSAQGLTRCVANFWFCTNKEKKGKKEKKREISLQIAGNKDVCHYAWPITVISKKRFQSSLWGCIV